MNASSSISPERLKRQGVPRLLPLLISEDAYKTTAQTSARATAEVAKASAVSDELGASVVPMFHLDADDVVTAHTADEATTIRRLSTGSIPLGVGGEMTIGFTVWVSRVAAPRVASRISRKVTRPKAKAKRPKRRPRRRK